MYWLFCDDKMYDVTLTSKKRKRKKLLCVKLAKKYLLIHTTLLSFRLGWNFSKDLIPGCVCVCVCVFVYVCVWLGWDGIKISGRGLTIRHQRVLSLVYNNLLFYS